MMKLLKRIFPFSTNKKSTDEIIANGVKAGVKKYYKTFIKLEKYDQGEPVKNPKILADPEGLQKYFRSIS